MSVWFAHCILCVTWWTTGHNQSCVPQPLLNKVSFAFLHVKLAHIVLSLYRTETASMATPSNEAVFFQKLERSIYLINIAIVE